MFWFKTEEGYVRDDAIIDVHINSYIPGKIMFRLTSGDSICYKNFGNDHEGAQVAMEEFMKYICGQRRDSDDLSKRV